MPRFTGQVYDVDFIARSGWCQVLVRGQNDTLVTRTADEGLICLALAGLLMRSPRTIVHYEGDDPKWLTGVQVETDARADHDVVAKLAQGIDSPYCRAEIRGPGGSVPVHVLDPRLRSIATEALAHPHVRFEYDAVDGVLQRAKLNQG